MEFIEGGGLLVLCALLVVATKMKMSRATSEWPSSTFGTNFLALGIVALGFFGLISLVDAIT